MKKNLKVLSSLALAGMLTTGVMGTSSAAITTKDVTSKVPGIYSNTLVPSLANVVPVILDNAKDVATMKDIINSGLFDKTAFQGFDENKQFRSGDTFKLKGKEYTVLIMGDADRNGIVDINDALEIAKYKRNVAGNKIEGDEIALESGNVRRAAGQGTDINDALRIQQFVLGQLKTKGEDIVDQLPDADVVEVYPYTLSVEGGYINNQNGVAGKTATVNIGLTPSDTAITGLTLKVLDANGKELPTSVTSGATFTQIDAHVDLYPVSGFDFSSEDDGTYTIQLLDKDNKVVGETTVEKNTVAPTATKVVAKRLNTKDATLSLEGYGTELKKVYYGIGSDATTLNAGITDQTKYLEVKENKLVDAVLDKELENNTSYTLVYVLENIYGSRTEYVTANVLKTIIPLDGDSVKEEPAVTNTITVPTLVGGDDSFAWTPDANMTLGATYTVRLYKDDKIVDEDTAVSSTNKDYTSKMTEAGRYKIGVVVNGASDGTTTASKEVQSGEVQVKKLQEVSKIDFTIPETGAERNLSWTDANAKEDIAGYTINIYQYDVANKKYDTTSPVATKTITDPNTNEIDIVTMDASFTYAENTMYQAEVCVDAKGSQKAVISSDKKLSEGFYEVAVTSANVESASDTSVTIAGITDTVSGFVPTYKVEVYEAVTETEGLIQAISKYKYVTTKDVTLTESGKIVVSGLNQNKNYGFKLIADVNGITGKSAPIYAATLPKIENLTRKTNVNEAKVAGTIYSDLANKVVYINGKETTLYQAGTTTLLYPEYKSLEDALTVVEKIHNNDIITIAKDTITVVLEGSKASDASDSIDFADTAAGKKLVLTGKARTQRTVEATADATGTKPAEVKLQGTDAMFKTDNLVADQIVLTNGVEILDATANKEFVIADNSTVTINGVKIKTDKQTTIIANGTTLNVKLKEGSTTTNNLTFTSENKAAVIGFVTIASGNPATYIGTIAINSNGGSVTVNTEATVNVSDVKLNVTAKDATVDLSGAVQANNSAVTTTVSTDNPAGTNATKFVPKKAIPTKFAVTGSMELKEYTDAEIVSNFVATANQSGITPSETKEIKEFINSFNLNGKGATISYTAGDNFVTISFTKAGTFTVEGIK